MGRGYFPNRAHPIVGGLSLLGQFPTYPPMPALTKGIPLLMI